MALPLRCAASLRLAGGEPSFSFGSSTRHGQRPFIIVGHRLGKSETCRASEWQTRCSGRIEVRQKSVWSQVRRYCFNGFVARSKPLKRLITRQWSSTATQLKQGVNERGSNARAYLHISRRLKRVAALETFLLRRLRFCHRCSLMKHRQPLAVATGPDRRVTCLIRIHPWDFHGIGNQ